MSTDGYVQRMTTTTDDGEQCRL